MKKLSILGIVVGGAFLCAAPISLDWSPAKLGLSVDTAQARIGRPLTPFSIAGVNRRMNRRAYYGGYGGYYGAHAGYYGYHHPYVYGGYHHPYVYGGYRRPYYAYAYGYHRPYYGGYHPY